MNIEQPKPENSLVTRRPYIVTKAWGSEQHHTNASHCMKNMTVTAGSRCSLHRHPIKDETFIVTGCKPLVVWFGISPESLTVTALCKGESIRIPPNIWHSFGSVYMSSKRETLVTLRARAHAGISGNAIVDLELQPGRIMQLFSLCQGSSHFVEASTHDDPSDCVRYRESEAVVSTQVNDEMFHAINDAIR